MSGCGSRDRRKGADRDKGHLERLTAMEAWLEGGGEEHEGGEKRRQQVSILSRSLSRRKGRETGNRGREKRSYVFPFFLFFSLKEMQAFSNAGGGAGASCRGKCWRRTRKKKNVSSPTGSGGGIGAKPLVLYGTENEGMKLAYK